MSLKPNLLRCPVEQDDSNSRCFTTLIVEEVLHLLTEKARKEVLQCWGGRV